jgi:lysophospholipase L1-like esterase
MVPKIKTDRSGWGICAIAILSLFLASCSSGPTGPPEPDLTEIVIVAFGNSITLGIGDVRRPAGYPFQLEQLLEMSHPNAIVVNRGVAGEHTTQGLRRLDRVLSKDRPDYVLILEGINDINVQTSSATIVGNLDAMVRMVKGRGAVPLISSLLPATKHGISINRIRTVNEGISAIAEREDIVFVDNYTAFGEDGDFTLLLSDDGLHPNSLGYNVMAEEWFDGLLDAF